MKTAKKIDRKMRNEFAGMSGYYETKGAAVAAYDSVLNDYDLGLDCAEMHGDEGRTVVAIHEVDDNYEPCDDPVGYAYLSWYRMPSGRYEFTGYIT